MLTVQLWMREHNRLCDQLGESIRSKFMSHDEQFELIRRVRSSCPLQPRPHNTYLWL